MKLKEFSLAILGNQYTKENNPWVEKCNLSIFLYHKCTYVRSTSYFHIKRLFLYSLYNRSLCLINTLPPISAFIFLALLNSTYINSILLYLLLPLSVLLNLLIPISVLLNLLLPCFAILTSTFICLAKLTYNQFICITFFQPTYSLSLV